MNPEIKDQKELLPTILMKLINYQFKMLSGKNKGEQVDEFSLDQRIMFLRFNEIYFILTDKNDDLKREQMIDNFIAFS